MLSAETKRHIDNARDILVGVAPNPITQIDQITYALIYKFMDDMDQGSIKLGGEPSFFTGNLKKYSWTKLLDSKLGNHEKMELYSEALDAFAEAKQLPELFRSIFKDAFLPYRSPETLGLFLKEINHFDYAHPEELGNAYEYLLSIMSAQGDAGQFRTPRHIIDFIVEVLDPKKDETVLDPACGTGGFLVSTYNHILKQHDGKDDPKGKEKPLTPDERKKLMNNLEGYDIDPTMTRIAQVNMYLHQFKNPKIFQYDTLTSEDRWRDKFDVIMANPPFMTPRGGIRPHSKFSIQSNRSEVLFVDYIANHLKPNGRAAIIVPDGVIFKTDKAYKVLRRNLAENELLAVVSLPSGVFKPYSGVKTSILILNKVEARKRKELLFIEINNDGFSLGDTRRPIAENDLPNALEILKQWINDEAVHSDHISLISRSNVLQSKDIKIAPTNVFEFVPGNYKMQDASELFNTLKPPKKIPSSEIRPTGRFPVIDQSISDIAGFTDDEEAVIYGKKPLVIFGDHTCAIKYVDFPFAQGADGVKILEFNENVMPRFAYFVFKTRPIDSVGYQRHFSMVKKYKFPVPPLEIQAQIVAELDGYAAIVEGAKKIVENWRPRIEVDPEWPIQPLGDLVEILDSKRKPITKSDRKTGPFPYYGATGIVDYVSDFIFDERLLLLGEDGAKWKSGDRTAFIVEGKYWVNNHAHVLRPKLDLIDDIYLESILNQLDLTPFITGVTVPKLNQERMREIPIPVPEISVQTAIAESVKREMIHVDSCNQLIQVYSKRMTEAVERLWA